MTTTLNPPPATTPPPEQRPASGASRVVAIIAIVVGAVVILGAISSAVSATIAAASVHTSSRTVAVSGVNELSVDVSVDSLRVEFGSVSEAELEVNGSAGADTWTFDRDGDRLTVASPNWFGGWFSWGWFDDDRGGNAVLRLPAALAGVDADLTLSAGELVVEDGEFGDLEIDLNAGRFDVKGSADSVAANMNAGRGDLEIADAGSASLTVRAGTLDAELTGAQPDSVEADVSAGSLQLTVPEGEYDVTSDVSAGGFDNRIGSSAGASSTIHVKASAGQIVLRTR
ncbi:MAG TPA: hypothetical protein VNP97_15315 [Microbacterium sp.]|nr:hypothetical protein [Microbacterium sp.]